VVKESGESHKTIARLTGVTNNMVTHDIKEYQSGGIERLKELQFKRMGLTRRKIGMVPAKADILGQEEFKKTLQPRLEEAKAGKRAVFFVDCAHFVLAPFLG